MDVIVQVSLYTIQSTGYMLSVRILGILPMDVTVVITLWLTQGNLVEREGMTLRCNMMIGSK